MAFAQSESADGFEIASFSEALATLRALQFLFSMRSQMAFQASPVCEAPLTLLALESLLSGVTPHVFLKGFNQLENPSAQVAFERFHSGVNFPMPPKANHFLESHSALVTYKRVLFRVNPHVSLKGTFTLKLFPH